MGFEFDDDVSEVTTHLTNVDVSELMQALSEVKEEDRIYFVDTLEKESLKLISDNPQEMERNIQLVKTRIAKIEEARKSDCFDTLDEACLGDIAESKDYLCLSHFILNMKGNQAAPFIRLFVEETAKLSASEQELPENHLRAFVRAMEKLPQWDENQARHQAEIVRARLQNLKSRRPVNSILKQKAAGFKNGSR